MFVYMAFLFLYLLVPGTPSTPMSGVAWGKTDITATEVLEGIQRRYKVTDFEADFHQESYLEAMEIVDTAQGHVWFRPPSQMRWHYKTPEEYILIMNQKNIWIYWPEDNQVMVGTPETYLGHAEMGTFFSEPSRLMESFRVERSDETFGRQNVYSLKLTPKKPDPNLDRAFLLISTDTFCIIEASSYNTFGDKTRIHFSNIRFDQGIDASLFNFVAPEGAQILQLAPR
jgi:outer membrane lipoprotein carrier protein